MNAKVFCRVLTFERLSRACAKTEPQPQGEWRARSDKDSLRQTEKFGPWQQQ